MVENRASKHYNHFIETFLFYQKLFESSGDITSIYNIPYPLYVDVIIKQVEDEKKRRDQQDTNGMFNKK